MISSEFDLGDVSTSLEFILVVQDKIYSGRPGRLCNASERVPVVVFAVGWEFQEF